MIRAVLQAVDVIRYTLHRFQNQRVHVVVHHFIVPIEAVQTQVLVTLGLEFPNHGVQIPPGGLHAVRQSLLRGLVSETAKFSEWVPPGSVPKASWHRMGG